MSNQNITHQPSGQPTGGQFAEAVKSASGISLSTGASDQIRPVVALQVFGPDRPLAARRAYHQMVEAREKYERVALAMDAHSERAKVA
ncbi:hypothetical protein [Pseudactinotalea sp. Z1748]|uniref:hypothetical protein n=1 Tax=Pseudactinotalea sp. Z1748 TaxID=3413027 RepID=UPI003C7DCD04